MFSRLFTTVAVALATSQLVAAQTFTACDPRMKSCPPDPAFGEGTVVIDFTKGESDLFTAAEGTTIKYGSNGAEFTIDKDTEAPTVTSTKYMFFGRLDVEVQVAPGTGIVTSIVLQSDDRDEIDWEWLGGDTAQVQTNYFGKGDDSTFNRGGFSPVGSPQTTTHTYSIDWTKDYVHWIIDGTIVRVLNFADAEGGSRFPQTPCQIKLGTWDAGAPSEPQGTIEWAGGLTDFSQAPFTAFYKKVTIQDSSNGVAGAKQYIWNSGSDGSYQSIKVDTTGGDDNSSSSSSSSAAPSSTATKNASSSAESQTSSATQTTMATAKSSASATSEASSVASQVLSQTGDAASSTETGSASSASGAAAATSAPPTAAGFKSAFSLPLIGAGVLAALAL
ncbi:concanavalin A-like lectin/glucanase domain-containing protein [Xylaria sp. CBS 124048]|nr:concanavalin A-like lectin/glucanase domain-containing protein [Xylaria sp. CBS 124048]